MTKMECMSNENDVQSMLMKKEKEIYYLMVEVQLKIEDNDVNVVRLMEML